MITLVEFLEPLKKKSLTDKCLAVLYYETRYKNNQVLAGSEIRKRLLDSRIPNVRNANVTALLNQVGAYVDTLGLKNGERLWKLTESGAKHIRDLLGLKVDSPEVVHDIATLENLISKVTNLDERDYLNEALLCLKVGALRATVVFAWVAAIRNIQLKCLAKGKKLMPALLKHDPKARTVKSIDDFAYIKDTTVLLACQNLGIFDKSQRETAEESLRLRNRCGHPAKYAPKEKKVSSYIEDLISVVFK
jgi:hypothetical protein